MLKTLTLLFIAVVLLFIVVPAQYKQKTLVAHRSCATGSLSWLLPGE